MSQHGNTTAGTLHANSRTKGDQLIADLKKCRDQFKVAARRTAILLRHPVLPFGAFALAALSLTSGHVNAASAAAPINVSITIEARCMVASADQPGRRGDASFQRDFAVHCTDSTPYQVLFDDELSRQSLNRGVLPPTGAKLLEIAF